MSDKFDLVVETAMRRYQGTSFLIGDRVKFVENIERHEWWTSQPTLKQERLKEMLDSGDNIRVSAVKAERPATAQTGHFQDVTGFHVDIVREAAPGLFMSNQIFTVPQDVIELQEDYPNLAGDTPEGQIKADPTEIDPREVSVEDNELSPVKQTGVGEGDKELADTNTDISTAPAAKSYTTKYMDS